MAPPAAIDVNVAAVSDTQTIALPDPTSVPQSINNVHFRSATKDIHSDKSQWGLAAVSASAQFKSPSFQAASKRLPKAKRWDDLLTEEAKARGGSSLKAAARFLKNPGMISLGGGLPSSAYFPFHELSITVPTVPDFDQASTAKTGTTLTAGKHDLPEGKSIFDIATAFNYGQGMGSAQLLRWVTEHTEMIHTPPYADWGCNLTIGSTSAFDMALRMSCNRGDCVLADQYTFSAAIETGRPMGLKFVGVRMDEQGILPDNLDQILDTWQPEQWGGARKPRVIYLVPTGQNPTGATMGTERRQQVYKVCQKHDVFILEDEPYYFLQMPDYSPNAPKDDPQKKTHDEFLSTLIPSFLSMDVDGRVMRMDSFSKVLSPGSRVGWVTASEQLIERYRMHVDTATQGPCGISQLVLFKLLDEHWGHGGYIDWLKYMRAEYTGRRDTIVSACDKHLPKSIVSWTPPKAGMFHWMDIDWTQHPMASTLSLLEIEEQLFMASVNHGALVLRGSWFISDENAPQDRMFFRATFGAAGADQIDTAIARFGDAIREVFGLQQQQNGQ